MLTSFFWTGDTIRSRAVSTTILTTTLAIPEPPPALLADWRRETTTRLELKPGDVEVMPLARTQARWSDYRGCVRAMIDWTTSLALPDVLAQSDIALMACRGARYHHDAEQYGSAAFCNLFLSEDKVLDLHFPHANRRIPLTRGTAVIFDTGQPHAVIPRNSNAFHLADFAPRLDYDQIFLTWELPIENAHVAQALNIIFDTDELSARQLTDEQLWLDGAPVEPCPQTGHWQAA
ncbi:hypothetical protein [Caballeronia sp. BR00000012568055]|uniref:hypothetical protein n=1 Tax=Caballeronia sp. BR00000012568055 TaxID=2918761 RepID=UPI0023F8EC17|nr:hypothetical protein [Caballeronia sp. BR00000012568055]